MEITFSLSDAGLPRVPGAIAEAIREAAFRVGLAVRENILLNLRGDPLHTRTGTLMRSWSGMPAVEDTASGPVVTLASSAVYSAIHEFGGTVAPVNKAFLTIPLEAVRNPSGTRTKFSAAELRDSPGQLGLKSTFINRARTAILGVQHGGGLVPLFAIADSVTIPARGYVSRAVARARAQAGGIVSEAVHSVMRRLGLA